jgi:hypothetical protein
LGRGWYLVTGGFCICKKISTSVPASQVSKNRNVDVNASGAFSMYHGFLRQQAI